MLDDFIGAGLYFKEPTHFGAVAGSMLCAVGLCLAASLFINLIRGALMILDVFSSGRAQGFLRHMLDKELDAAQFFAHLIVTILYVFGVAAFAMESTTVLLIGFFLAAGAPLVLLSQAQKRFDRALDLTLPGALQQVANELSVTPSLDRALEAASKTAASPAKEELALLRNSIATLGVEAALDRTSARLRSKSFSLTAAVIRVGTGRGGRMIDAIKGLSATLIELERLNRKIDAAGAGGRRAILLLFFAGLAIPAGTWIYLPGQQDVLFTSSGQTLIIVAIAIFAAALMLARKILKVRV